MAFKWGVQADGSWNLYAGDWNRVRWELVGEAPVDITGCVITCQARKVDTGPLAMTAVVEMTDPPAGVFHIAWDGEEVRAVLEGKSAWEGLYDIQIQWPQEPGPRTRHRAPLRAQMDITRDEVAG